MEKFLKHIGGGAMAFIFILIAAAGVSFITEILSDSGHLSGTYLEIAKLIGPILFVIDIISLALYIVHSFVQFAQDLNRHG